MRHQQEAGHRGKRNARRGRGLAIESLETRRMLSGSPGGGEGEPWGPLQATLEESSADAQVVHASATPRLEIQQSSSGVERARAALQLYLRLLQQLQAARARPAAQPAANPAAPAAAPPQPLGDVAWYGGADQWSLNAVKAPEAWAAGYRGQGVTVAVIDTGVDWSHGELRSNIWKNRGEIAGNGRDDDGNGYVDDLIGWDFVQDDNNPSDANGHGTHVAGIIAAARDANGMTGVAYASEIMVLRALDASGSGSTRDIAEAIRYAVDNGAQVINLSLGGGSSAALEAALEYAAERDVLVVAAAGNNGAESPNSPAAFSQQLPNVLSVGATDREGQTASFSNSAGAAVQVVAPGVRIVSTVPGGVASYSGTSMAAPHVAGVAALALSAAPQLGGSQLRALLTEGVAGAAGRGGRGLVDAAQTVAFAAQGYLPKLESPVASSSAATGALASSAAQQVGEAFQGLPDSRDSAANSAGRPALRIFEPQSGRTRSDDASRLAPDAQNVKAIPDEDAQSTQQATWRRHVDAVQRRETSWRPAEWIAELSLDATHGDERLGDSEGDVTESTWDRPNRKAA